MSTVECSIKYSFKNRKHLNSNLSQALQSFHVLVYVNDGPN